METVARELKAIVDESGPGVLTREPYQVFERLRRAGGDLGLSAALLHALVMGASERAQEGLTQAELEGELRATCHLDEEMAAAVARVLSELFSKENTDAWEERDRAGFAAFCEHEHEISWRGYVEWDAGGVYVPCEYELNIVVRVASKDELEDYFFMTLARNPFISEADLETLIAGGLKGDLKDEFEEYCVADDYYPPVAEDFDPNQTVEEWCKDVGLELVSIEGYGTTGDYEPKERWRW